MRHLLCCALLLPGLAAAEIYRWTDAEGRVHFSERPAAGAEQVEVKPQVVERDDATREREARTERFFEARRQEQEKASAQALEQRAKREQECRQLRQNLAQFQGGGIFYREGPNGERIYYSDSEVDATRRQLSSKLAERCG